MVDKTQLFLLSVFGKAPKDKAIIKESERKFTLRIKYIFLKLVDNTSVQDEHYVYKLLIYFS